MNKQTGHHSCLIQNENLSFTITPDWFEQAYWQQQDAILGSAAGRGTTLFFRHADTEYVMRTYLRGGLIGKLIHDQYLFLGWQATRAWQEFELLEWMHSIGLPVPLPIAGWLERNGLTYRAKLIMQRLDAAEDLIDVLAKRAIDQGIWNQIGATIARMHQANVYHHDLNCKNIMLDANDKVWLIDFDRCCKRKTGSWKQQNLQRLHRSFTKELSRKRLSHFSEQQWAWLLAGYNSLPQQ